VDGDASLVALIVSAAAAIGAIAAVVVAVWQGVETRHHNRQSVAPHLTYYTFFTALRPCLGIEVSNNGIGPAIVTGFDLFVDGEMVTDRTAGGWPEALRKLALDEAWVQFHWFDVSDGIRVGQSVWLVGISLQDCDPDREEALRKALARLRIRVEYKSVYGDERLLEIKELTGVGPTGRPGPHSPSTC